MQYNLLPRAIWSVNTTEGSTELNFSQLRDLLEYGNDPVVYLSEPDKLVLDFDLGARVHLDRVDYKFESDSIAPSLVASGIDISYKNEEFETIYTSLATYTSIEPNTYSATVSGSSWYPRYIRVSHTVSGTVTTSGSLYGIRVLNDDTVVDFGVDGLLDQVDLEVARGGIEEVKEVPIYNNGTALVDALVNIEPSFSELDEIISVGLTEQGPWVKPLDTDLIIFDYSTLGWGIHNGTELYNNRLRLDGFNDFNDIYSTWLTSGNYTSRIIHKPNDSHMYIVVNKDTPVGGRISVDFDDPTETIEVRYSDYKPKDYFIFREFYQWYESYNRYYSYRDRWAETQTVKESNTSQSIELSQYTPLSKYMLYMDEATEKWCGIFSTYGNDYRAHAETRLFVNDGSGYKNTRLSVQSNQGEYGMSCFYKDIKMESAGGLWVLFYHQGYNTGDFCNQTGYFLAHFDEDLNNTFKWYNRLDHIKCIDVDYIHLFCWYIRTDNDTIYKIDTNGNSIANFAEDGYTAYLSALSALPDNQGIWFVNGLDLHRLNYNGTLLENYSIEEAFDYQPTDIAIEGDGSEYLWVIENQTVGRFHLTGDKKGQYDFQVDTVYPNQLHPTSNGCWVYCLDAESQGSSFIRFIPTVDKRVTIERSFSNSVRPAFLQLDYTNENYTSKMPIAPDTVWSSLPWHKVAVDSFLLNESKYLQTRVTLRRKEAYEVYEDLAPGTDFMYEDTFEQSSAEPNQLMWFDWRDKNAGTGLDRVYVDTVNDELVMLPSDVQANAYIRTRDRVLVAADDVTGDFEFRVKYRIGDGPSGGPTGKEEYIYLYAYSANPGYEGEFLGGYLRIRDYDQYAWTYARISTASTSFYSSGKGDGRTDFYEGELRLYADDNGILYFQVAPGTSGSFTGIDQSNWKTCGSRWYLQISTSHNGSPIHIDKAWIRQGRKLFYTDTPRISSLNNQELLELENVYPNSSKSVYVRTQVPQSQSTAPNYDADLKVRWRVPIN